MKAETYELTLIFEGTEIRDLWNVVMFALDYDTKDNIHMTNDERKLAEKIVEITKQLTFSN